MLNLPERSEVLAALRSPEVEERAAMLKDLLHNPTGDVQVRAAVEALLEDHAPCVVQIPLRIGEVRWLAARALAAERSAGGVAEPVVVKGIVRPLEVGELAERTLVTLGAEAVRLSLFDRFEKLLSLGQLPVVDLEIEVET